MQVKYKAMKIIKEESIKDAVYRIAANLIISVDLAKRCCKDDSLSKENYSDCMKHLYDNAISTAAIIGGEKGTKLLMNIIEKRNESDKHLILSILTNKKNFEF